MEKHSGNEIIRLFTEVAPYINEITSEDIGISVIKENYLTTYVPGKAFNLGIKAGEHMQGQVTEDCIKKGSRIIRLISHDQSVFGVPYIACAWPVKEGEKTVGCVVTTQAIDNQEKINIIASELAASSQEFTAGMEELAASASELSVTSANLGALATELSKTILETNQILTLVDSMSRQTNLLGINAAIESARVGEAGKGFGVVAGEVRKLASVSSESVKSIAELLGKVQGAIAVLNKKVNSINETVQNQDVSIQELAKISESLAGMANELSNVSNNMFRLD